MNIIVILLLKGFGKDHSDQSTSFRQTWKKNKVKGTMLYTFHLSVSLLVMLSILPGLILQNFNDGKWTTGKFGCMYTAAVIDISKITCPYFAVIIAIQRMYYLYNVMKHNKSKLPFNKKWMVKSIWFLAVFMALPSFFLVKYEEFYLYD